MFGLRRRSRSHREALEPGRRRSFADPDLEHALSTDGFVVVRLLDTSAATDLRAALDGLDHRHDAALPYVEGFHTTLYDGRTAYRRQVAHLIETALAPALDALLPGHRIHVSNRQRKGPGAALLPAHLDWTWLDEARATALTVWCALDPTGPENGCLSVFPGTHRDVSFLRAVNNRHYDRHEAVGAGRSARDIPLRPGEAAVFDTRLLHLSHPNRSDRERVAASCVAVPGDRPTHHHWFDDAGVAHRLTIEPAFWWTYRIGEDPRRLPGCLGSTVVEDQRYS